VTNREQMKAIAPQWIRNLVRPIGYLADRTFVDVRRAFGKQGKLPDFLMLGVQKAGTTTLYDVLCQHPEIHEARTKELAFFDRYHGRGVGWYAANFPDEPGLTGEATPDYLFDPAARERIVAALPAAKFVVLLRNPVDRAISQYFHAKRLGYERMSLEDALAQEEQRTGPDGQRFAGNPIEGRRFFHAYSYFARGDYACQLKAWFETVGRHRFHVEFSDRFFAEPDAVAREVFKFLGVTQDVELEVRPRNIGRYTSQVSEVTYAALVERYRPVNEKLVGLLGRPIPW